MITPTKNLDKAKGYDVTPPSVRRMSIEGRRPKGEAPTDIIAREHEDYLILAPSSVRVEPEVLTHAVLEDWSKTDPAPLQAIQGGASLLAVDGLATLPGAHTTARQRSATALDLEMPGGLC